MVVSVACRLLTLLFSGPRNCIGRNLAYCEMRLILVRSFSKKTILLSYKRSCLFQPGAVASLVTWAIFQIMTLDVFTARHRHEQNGTLADVLCPNS